MFLVALLILAAGPDYGNHDGWNGISSLLSLDEAITLDSTLDWGAIDPERDALLLLSPTTAPDPRQLAHFIRAGGVVLVAEDFRKGAAVFEALGVPLRRHPHRFPFAYKVDSDSPLASGVRVVACNHPAYFEPARGVVLAFADPMGALLASTRLGKGTLILLSDPSIFINDMIDRQDNGRLVRNLLEALSQGGRTIHVLVSFAQLLPRRRGGLVPSVSALISMARDLLRWVGRQDVLLRIGAFVMLYPLLLLLFSILLYFPRTFDARRELTRLQRRIRLGRLMRAHFPISVDPEREIRKHKGPRALFLYRYLRDFDGDDDEAYEESFQEFRKLMEAPSLKEAGEHPSLIPPDLQ